MPRSFRQPAPQLTLWLATFAMSLAAGQLRATGAEHSFWEVSSRHLPDQSNTEEALEVRRRTATNWLSASGDALLADCTNSQYQRVVVYVHGNWTDWPEARRRAQLFYSAATEAADSPICFIAYSWPSDREKGFVRDVLGKKGRIDLESHRLAQLVQRLPADTPIGMISFSFGTRISCGVLHLLSGGELAGRALTGGPCQSRQESISVSLLAPAFDRASFLKNGKYDHALLSVDHLVNLFNPVDPVLKRFRFFDKQTRPVAAGYLGLQVPRTDKSPSASSPALPPLVQQYDCHRIGRTHSELAYCSSGAFKVAINNVLGRSFDSSQ